MLLNVHVKNLALIDEIEMNFEDHLNILTGETGAGKSVLMGAVNMALGAKVSKDMIRKGADYALSELFFSVKDPRILETLQSMEIPIESDAVVISRRMTHNRSVCRINGEIVSLADVKKVGHLLLDIHGQHDHQSLLDKHRHRVILDRFLRNVLGDRLSQLEKAFQEYSKLLETYQSQSLDNEQRLRQMDYLEFELNELEQAHLIPGEDERLEADYKKMLHSREIMERMSKVYQVVGYETKTSIGELIGVSLKNISGIEAYDETLVNFRTQLENIESMVNDLNWELSNYIGNLSFNEQDFYDTEERLNLINRLKSKYGPTIEMILNEQKKKRAELERLQGFDDWYETLKLNLKQSEERVKCLSNEISAIRKEHAHNLEQQMEESLKDLNFLEIRFKIQITPLNKYSRYGMDDIEFLVSTNPGEDLKPLGEVASGGELSRIMLGIKSVLAQIDDIPTLIFDEIDTGISGRTAQKVAEKMAYIGLNHQILCITHLPQIAAMADTHYMIEKITDQSHTKTEVRKLDAYAQIQEVGRLMGGVEITQSILDSADEMKKMAEQFRLTCFKKE